MAPKGWHARDLVCGNRERLQELGVVNRHRHQLVAMAGDVLRESLRADSFTPQEPLVLTTVADVRGARRHAPRTRLADRVVQKTELDKAGAGMSRLNDAT